MKVKVSLELSGTSDVQICVDGKNYTNSIKASTNFKAPAVSSAEAALIVEQVDIAETAVTTLTNAIAAPVSASRNDDIAIAREVTDKSLSALGRTVETIANGPNVPDSNRIAIVHSAGMNVKASTNRQKQIFAAETGDTDGTVNLYAKGIPRGSHEWRYTIDTTGFTNWTTINATLQAATVVSNLESGKMCAFSHRTIEKNGPTDWENPIIARPK